jgi:MFS family permease
MPIICSSRVLNARGKFDFMDTQENDTQPDTDHDGAPRRLGRNVYALGAVSFFTDVSSEMIYPLLPVFLATVLGVSAGFIGAIEGAAESTAALLKLASGWWSDHVRRRKPLVVAGYALASAVRPLVAVAQSATQVLLIRVSDRVGKGIRSSPRDALIADSVHPTMRGRAFGVRSAADNAGALLGPVIAFVLLSWFHLTLRTVFWLAAIPGVIAVIVAVTGIREVERQHAAAGAKKAELRGGMGARFWAFLTVIFVFTLGNSTDAFLLLRAKQLGVPVALAPILWALLNGVKSLSNVPGGALSDRLGRRPVLIAGWAVYAAVYFLFARATSAWHAWALFAAYGIFFGLTEGTELALVADVVPAERRGAAYGWYYLAIGIGALPASLLFGLLWDRFGSPVAFAVGAGLALVAALALLVMPRGASLERQR